MQSVWVLLGDEDDERERFADLETTLHQPSTPAGPDNRLRHVRKITVGNRTWFLKIFTATQWKNRLRFLLTRPRARDDAERELRVTEALRHEGVAAPRPVAYGRSGRQSFYLCAELEGRPLSDWLVRPAADPAMTRGAARSCGQLLRAGFRLPDLSPDHVFVRRGSGQEWSFAVLDLHNGRCGAAGPPPRRLLRRVLRRFAKAARGTPAAGRGALRFAVRLIRAAGVGDARKVLAALPPLWTADRYEAAGKSSAYAGRNPARATREATLLRAVWPGRRGETVLDLPCGTARLLPWLRDDVGHRVVLGDAATAMLQQARAAHGAQRAVRADALALPFADRSVDGVVAFRFLHHLPNNAARDAIAEACRVAGRFVVVSFFHPCSFHHLQRQIGRLFGSPPTRFARQLGAVRADFERHGFELDQVAADLPYTRDLWVASFVRC